MTSDIFSHAHTLRWRKLALGHTGDTM